MNEEIVNNKDFDSNIANYILTNLTNITNGNIYYVGFTYMQICRYVSIPSKQKNMLVPDMWKEIT